MSCAGGPEGGFGSWPVAALSRSYRAGEVTVGEVVEAVLADIDVRNDELGAFITVLHDDARARAAFLDQLGWEVSGPLFGVPIAIKDLADFKAGVRNTFGTRLLSDYVPSTSSVHVQRLEAAGAVIVGKTNVPEFGHKGVTDNHLIGPARLPENGAYNAGGSSGGSASAVAAGLVPLAQGSDGGGSVRIPAALCGLVGVKPTFGRIPTWSRPNAFVGDRPFVGVGPLSRTVADAALMVDVMSGRCPRDPWSYDPAERLGDLYDDPQTLRAGYCKVFGTFPVEAAVRRAVDGAVNVLRGAGTEIDDLEVDLGASHDSLCELWLRQIGLSYLSTLDALAASGRDVGLHRSELCNDLQDILSRGEQYDLRQMRADDALRTAVLDALEQLLDRYDVLLTPTNSVAAIANRDDGYTVGPASVDGVGVNPLLGWCLTFPINLTGHPAASVPVPYQGDGHVGLQVIGRRYGDVDVVRFARHVEVCLADGVPRR